MGGKLKIYVKYGLIVLFAGLIAYGFFSGSITADTIVELFRGIAEVKG